MNWRPDGWKNPYDGGKEIINEGWRVTYALKPQKYYLYEAGADAMLEALSQQNVTLPDIIHHYTTSRLGKLAVIPDDENEVTDV